MEPGFLPVWRRYARALKQRNALLKRQPAPSALAPWDRELAEAGESLSTLRADYLARLEPILVATAGEFLPELGAPACVSCPAGAARKARSKTPCC